MEQRNADVRQVTGRGTAGDDTARFLHELRQLRDGAGLGAAELAARAHYPYDRIKAAEVGPALPDLPVLSAYVRGCGGTTEEWEERWRSLTRTPSLPVSAARNAGQSAAASAGARISSTALDGDAPNPAVILAALNRVAEEMAGSADDTVQEPESLQSWTEETVAEPADPAPAAPAPSVPAPAAPAPAPAAAAPAVAVPAAENDPLAESLSGAKPSGWDPIRVSSAWPVIPESAGDPRTSRRGAASSPAGPSSGSAGADPAAPWGTAPWAADPSAGPTAGRRTSRSVPRPRPSGRASGDAARPQATGAGATRTGTTGTGVGLSSRTKIVAIAVVLLCVLAILLAIFA